MRKLLSVIVLISFLGCSQPKEEKLSFNGQAMYDVLKDVNKEDCQTLYYLFGGIANYTDKYDGIKKNSQAFSLFKIVKERFGKGKGWLDKPSTMDDPNDIIESNLKQLKFENSQEFTTDSKAKFVELFFDYEKAALKSWKEKK